MSEPVATFRFDGVVRVVKDRYSGIYSGALFTAWIENVPPEISDDDVTCSNFWDSSTRACGKGATPAQAFDDLLYKLLGMK